MKLEVQGGESMGDKRFKMCVGNRLKMSINAHLNVKAPYRIDSSAKKRLYAYNGLAAPLNGAQLDYTAAHVYL